MSELQLETQLAAAALEMLKPAVWALMLCSAAPFVQCSSICVDVQ